MNIKLTKILTQNMQLRDVSSSLWDLKECRPKLAVKKCAVFCFVFFNMTNPVSGFMFAFSRDQPNGGSKLQVYRIKKPNACQPIFTTKQLYDFDPIS